MTESAKRHEENSNIIKEIRASTDAAIRNQGASIKTLEIQIGQMSKHRSIFFETVPFPRRLQDYYCDDWKEAQDVKILEAYDHNLPQKEKEPGSFTLPSFITIDDEDVIGEVALGMPFFMKTLLSENQQYEDIDQDSAHMVAASKFPMRKPGEFELWRMRIEQYIQMIDYALWEVIENGATLQKTAVVEGVEKLKFNSIKDAKLLLEAAEKRFGGNAATKKTQRNLLKQQYENFTALSSEMLD
ncbi:hypothetical protein Tco_0474192 [Tanacetum coccineum]